MKKVVFIMLLSVIALCACKKDVESDDYNSYSVENANYLVITNPTKNKKTSDEVWVKISLSEDRRIITESLKNKANYYNYVEHTDPFANGDLSKLNLKSERVASTKPVKARGYKLGEQINIEDSYSNKNAIASLVYEGQYCYIWTYKDEPDESALSEEEIKAFADKFDSVYLKQIALCGPKYNGITVFDNVITPAKKLSIMLCDIGQDKGYGNIYGYFHSSNYFDKNKMEIIFVDSYYAKIISLNLMFSTLVHEFNHLLNYCNKTLKYGLAMSSWYTEMLSMITEDFFSDDLCLNFNETPKKRLLGLVNGSYIHGFGNWSNESPFISDFYTNAYAFGAFLARNYGGADLIHEIMINEFVDEESVVNAVNKINGTSYSFADLLLDFSTILINPHNEDSSKCSLFKSTENPLGGDGDFIFRLQEIDLENLSDDSNVKNKIRTNDLEEARYTLFDSYGFQIYEVSDLGKTKVTAKKHLKVTAIN